MISGPDLTTSHAPTMSASNLESGLPTKVGARQTERATEVTMLFETYRSLINSKIVPLT
jgi:hypothetical protein